MDIDVIAKHMPGLLEFKKRIEALLEGAESGLGSVADAIKAEITEIRGHLSETADAVSSLQKLKDDVDAAIAAAVASVEEKLAMVTAELDAKLAPLSEVAAWLGENKQALEVLLSIGDDLGPAPAPAPAPEAEPQLTPEPAADPAAVAEPEADPLAAAPAEQAPTAADQPVT